jgi:hypothetical protein
VFVHEIPSRSLQLITSRSISPQCKRLGTKPTVVPKDEDDEDDVDDETDDLDDEADDEDEDDEDALLAEANELEASEEELASGKIPGQKALKTLYELNDTLFAEAEVEENGQVGLWLGVSRTRLIKVTADSGTDLTS